MEAGRTWKVVLVGDAYVGKSTLIHMYAHKSLPMTYPTYIHTIGVDFVSHHQNNDRFILWDTAGLGRFHAISMTYIRGSSIVLFVFDVTNRISFQHVEEWFLEAQKIINMENTTMMLIGNKIDRVEERVISKEQAEQLANNLGLVYFEASALDNNCLDAAFNYTIQDQKDILNHSRRFTLTPKMRYREVTLILQGNTGVGKTSIWDRYFLDSFRQQHYTTTNTYACSRIRTFKLDEERIKLTFSDATDSDQWLLNQSDTHKHPVCYMLVFSVKDRNSFDKLSNKIKDIFKTSNNSNILLVGNKCDSVLPGDVCYDEVQELAANFNLKYVEVSAKQGTNIEYAVTMATVLALRYHNKVHRSLSLESLTDVAAPQTIKEKIITFFSRFK